MTQINVFAMDLAKSKFQVHGYDNRSERCLVKTLKRSQVLAFFEARPERCLVVMEACGGAHYWGRQLQTLGYRVRLIPPQFVMPFVVGNKTDGNDTDAIFEASGREKVRPVPVKSIAQQDALLVHVAREQLVKTRTALMNEMRGLLAERGRVFSKGHRALRSGIKAILAEDPAGDITGFFQAWLAQRLEDWSIFDARIRDCDQQIQADYQNSPACTLIGEIPGIGPITATATVAMIGQGQQFRSSRHYSGWLGVVPKENSSGEKRRLGSLTKRGDVYLRKLYVHGARAVVSSSLRKAKTGAALNERDRWIQALVARADFNKACVAMANKNARIVRAMLNSGECYRAPRPIAA